MTDLALAFQDGAWDLVFADGLIGTDDGLATAIAISLFTDARARADDPIPPGADPRGWWGDAFNADPDDRIGSRLWTLRREKLTAATALRARDMVREALQWLLDDQVVTSIDIEVVMLKPDASRFSGALLLTIWITRPGGPARERYDFVWDATIGSLSA